jgi:hypothetical protein
LNKIKKTESFTDVFWTKSYKKFNEKIEKTPLNVNILLKIKAYLPDIQKIK